MLIKRNECRDLKKYGRDASLRGKITYTQIKYQSKNNNDKKIIVIEVEDRTLRLSYLYML